jgi:DNA-binding NarL/FixJ family response regulator
MKSPELPDALNVKPITVLLAEDHADFRKSLKLLIEADGGLEVVDEAKNGCEAVVLSKCLKPDVVVMDIAMPLLNGLQATRKIRANSPDTRVLILSAHPDPEYIQQAMQFGASGYLIKQSSTQFLARAIREIVKGNTYFSASIPKELRDECDLAFSRTPMLKKRAA